jgi:hypothetical protein
MSRAIGILKWKDLPLDVRAGLSRKLEDLYGQGVDESAFEALAIDKQQALLLLQRRFCALGLSDAVRRIQNVYGEGGVGMNFTAWPFLRATLGRRRDFSSRFARHRDTDGGFIERGPKRAALHLLYVDRHKKEEYLWTAHFDLYNWRWPQGIWRHFIFEKIKGVRPDWHMIRVALETDGV